jgi:diadenosine tetraphosphate (Ap4A) HIT family hydrolase
MIMKTHASQCRFCSLLSGANDQFDSVWLEDQRHQALVSVGAFVPGWSLICPVAHSVNLSTEYKDEAFWAFASNVAAIVTARYGSATMFEHGAIDAQSETGCGVGHAHAHVVPLDFDLEAEVLSTASTGPWARCRADEIYGRIGGSEYLFLANELKGKSTEGLLCILKRPVSQFFREVIARRLRMSDVFNYRQFPMLKIATASAAALREQARATSAA